MNPNGLADLLQRKQQAPAGSDAPLAKVLPRFAEASAGEAMRDEEFLQHTRVHPRMVRAAVAPRNPLRTFISPRVAAVAAIPLLTLAALAADSKDAENARKSSEANAPADPAAAADLQITQNIRRAVIRDRSLTMTAKNVKITTAGGRVSLAGPVKTAEEKKRIEDFAMAAAGKDNVFSEIEVKALGQP